MAEKRPDEESELERLRRENTDLRSRNSELESRRTEAGPPPRRWRWPTAVTLIVIGSLLLAAAVPAVWAANTLLNTDRYTETVAPLAQDPNIRSSVAVATVDRLFTRADVETRVKDALPPKAAFLAPDIASSLRGFSVTAAEKALATQQFQTLWTEANRQAHQRIVPALLTGTAGPSGGLSVEQGAVTLDISKIVGQVKQALISRGLTFVSSVPDTIAGGSVVLMQSSQLGQVQTALRTLQTLSILLPLLTLIAFVVAVAVAPDRRRAVVWLSVGAILAMLVLGGGLALVRNAYVSSPPAGILTGSAAIAFFDTLVRFLQNAIRTVGAIAVVLLIGAAIAGPSTPATRMRTAVGGGMSSLGLDLGRPAVWTDRHRRGLEALVVVIAAIVLFATNLPTPGLVLTIAIVAVLAILLIELVAHAHAGPPMRGQPSM